MEIPSHIGSCWCNVASLLADQLNFCARNHGSRGIKNLTNQRTSRSGLAKGGVRKDDG